MMKWHATLAALAAVCCAQAQWRPAPSLPVEFRMLAGTTNDPISSVYRVEGVRMRIEPNREWNTAAVEFTTPYIGGTVMRLYSFTMPLPPSGHQETLLYNYKLGAWTTVSSHFIDFNTGPSVHVPVQEYVDPRTGMVKTRVIWRLSQPTNVFEVDSVEWTFGY